MGQVYAESDYAEELVQKAIDQKLDQSRYWKLLLHYKHAFFREFKSEMADPKFFNASDGYKNPLSELKATIRSFFGPPITLVREGKETKEHPQCLFIDRYRWLKAKLHFDPQKLKEENCPKFLEWKMRMNPESVTFVFSSYFIYDPSSVFGHTLLRLNNTRHGENSRLLDFGINYAASRTVRNTFLYGILGIFGGLPGQFENVPYYAKVQEYSNSESRDIWEYDLNLTPSEIDRLLYHLWTVGHFSFPYHFFDGNCSYMLLTLIEAARPTLFLSNQFPGWVIPADTIRVVNRQSDLIRMVNARPSLVTKIKYWMDQLDSHQKEQLYDLFEFSDRWTEEESAQKINELEKISAIPRASITRAALEYLQYRKLQFQKKRSRKKEKTPEENRDESLKKLLLTSLNAMPPSVRIPSSPPGVPQRDRPDQGHKTMRIELGGGWDDLEESFEQVGFRFSFHDLNAKSVGYPRFSEIELLHLKMRYYNESSRIKLESFDLVNIASITPYHPFFNKSSWAFYLGVDTLRDGFCGKCNQGRVNYGMGQAFHLFSDRWTHYFLIRGEFAYSSYLDKDFRIAPGVEGGLLWDLSDDFSIRGGGEIYFPIFGQISLYGKASVEGRLSVFEQAELRLGFSKYWDTFELNGKVNFYF